MLFANVKDLFFAIKAGEVSENKSIYFDQNSNKLIAIGWFANLAVKLCIGVTNIISMFIPRYFSNMHKSINQYKIKYSEAAAYINSRLDDVTMYLSEDKTVTAKSIHNIIKQDGFDQIVFSDFFQIRHQYNIPSIENINNNILDSATKNRLNKYKNSLMLLIQNTATTAKDIDDFFKTIPNEDQKKFLEKRYDPNSYTLINLVIQELAENRYLNIDVLKPLIDLGKFHIDIDYPYKDIRAIFLSASKQHNQKIVEFLFDNKDNIKQINIAIYNLFRYGPKDAVEFLVENFGYENILNMTIEDGVTVITMACSFKNTDILKFLLDKFPDETKKTLTRVDGNGNTNIMYACRYSKPDMLALLLNQGLDLNIKNKFGGTALMSAAMGNNLATIKFLLDNKLVDINQADSYGNNIFMLASMVDEIYPFILNFLLKEYNANNLNQINNSGETALILACKSDSIIKISYLLENEADLSIQDNNGETAIDYLIANHNFKRYYENIDNIMCNMLENYIHKLEVTAEKKAHLIKVVTDKGYKKTADIFKKIKVKNVPK